LLSTERGSVGGSSFLYDFLKTYISPRENLGEAAEALGGAALLRAAASSTASPLTVLHAALVREMDAEADAEMAAAARGEARPPAPVTRTIIAHTVSLSLSLSLSVSLSLSL